METNTTDKNKLASFISLVTNPVGMVFIMLLALSLAYSIPYLHIFFLMSPFVVGSLGYVLLRVFVLKDADFDLTKLKSRRYLGISAACGLIVSYVLTHNIYPELDYIFLRVGIIVFVSGLVSQRWKISFHAIGYTSMALSYYRLFGNQWLILILFLPIVYWARITLNKHSLYQLLAGSILSLVLLL